MRVGLCGSHGTGKTTILNLFDYPKITEIARDTILELGKSLSEMDVITKIAFQEIVFGRQVQRERLMKDFVSDRTIFDILAYTSVLGSTREFKMMEDRVERYVKENPYDYVLYFPVEFPPEDDGLRFVGNEFQSEIDKIIVGYLNKYGIQYYTVRGTIDERKAFIDTIFNLPTLTK